MDATQENRNELVWAWVRRIPPGRVMSYGQIAAEVDRVGVTARTVGWALSACPEDVPWWRVVNAKGKCSVPGQQLALRREGVVFDARGRLDLERYRWEPGA